MTASEYNQCVSDHADNLFRFVVKHVRQEELARDIVQDCFEKMWIRKDDVDFLKSKSYLFTTGYHTIVDYFRKNGRIQYTDRTEMPNAFVTPVQPDLQDILHEALNKLPEIQKSVLLLRDYEGYSYEEIGEITSLNESQVKVYIYRARIAMKNYIGKLESII